MEKFNNRIFGTAVLVTVLLNFVSWAALEAHETQHRFHALLGILGNLWTILRFPTYTLFWSFLISHNNLIYYSGGVLINCICYGIIVERIFSLFHKKQEIQYKV